MLLHLKASLPAGHNGCWLSYANPTPYSDGSGQLSLIDVAVRSQGFGGGDPRLTTTIESDDVISRNIKNPFSSTLGNLLTKIKTTGSLLRNKSGQAGRLISKVDSFVAIEVRPTADGATQEVVLTLPPGTSFSTDDEYGLLFYALGLQDKMSDMSGTFGIANETEETVVHVGKRLMSSNMRTRNVLTNEMAGRINRADLDSALELEELNLELRRNTAGMSSSVTIGRPPKPVSSVEEAVEAVLNPLLKAAADSLGLMAGTFNVTGVLVPDEGYKFSTRADRVVLDLGTSTCQHLGLGKQRRLVTLTAGVEKTIANSGFPTDNALRDKLPVIVTSENASSASYMSGVGTVSSIAYVDSEYGVTPGSTVSLEPLVGSIQVSLYQIDYSKLKFPEPMDLLATFEELPDSRSKTF